MKNPETGRSRGFGFVTFKDVCCIELVLSSGPHFLDGRTIDPKSCNTKGAKMGKREAKMNNYPKVFLGGLPSNVNETLLREFFSKYGKVVEVVIMYNQEKKTGKGNGFRGERPFYLTTKYTNGITLYNRFLTDLTSYCNSCPNIAWYVRHATPSALTQALDSCPSRRKTLSTV